MCAFVLYTCIRWFCLPRNCCFNAKDIYRVLNNTFVGRKSSDLDASIHIILYYTVFVKYVEKKRIIIAKIIGMMCST